MPLQQISLDQSIYKKGQAAYSQALRPQGGKPYKGPIVNPSQGWTGLPGFSDEAKGIYQQNSFVDKQKEEWAAADKATKQQRDQQLSQLQNIGMQTVQQQQQQKQQVQQQQAQTKQQIESNPEPAAKEMYELMKTLPDEAKQQLLQQIFTPTSTGGSISSGGKEVKMGAKYNPIAGVFLEKGWAMFDPKGNVNLSEPEPTYEKGTFEIVEKGGKVYKFNTATNEEVEMGSTGDPVGTVNEIVKQIESDAIEVVKTSNGKVSLEDARHDAAINYGLDETAAKELAKFKGMPKDKNSGSWKKIWEFMKKPIKETSLYVGKDKGTTAKPTFNEANVTALVQVLHDEVTPAERAYLKSQGASDSDIDEAIKRKGQ